MVKPEQVTRDNAGQGEAFGFCYYYNRQQLDV